MSLSVIATDGHPLPRPRRIGDFLSGPGQRFDAIAIGPQAGSYAIRTLNFRSMAWRETFAGRHVATILSSGAAMTGDAETAVAALSCAGPRWIDEVAASAIARERRLIFRAPTTATSS